MLKRKISYVLIVLFVFNLFAGINIKSVEAATIVEGEVLTLNNTLTYDRKTSDNKYFEISLKQGEYVSIASKCSLSSGSVAISVVSSADSNAISFKTSGDSTSLTDGKFGAVNFVAPKDGTYFIKVSGTGYGRIALTPYRGWQNPEEKDEKRTFSSTFNTAKYIVDGTYNLETATGDYVNYYRFNGQAGSQISINIAANINSGTLYARLYDLDGNIIDNQYIGLSNGANKTMKYTIPVSSVYYLKVYGAVGSFALTTTGIAQDKDSDGDKLLDSIEYCRKTNPAVPDTDGDGTDDYNEVVNGKKPLLKNEYTETELINASTTSTAIPIKFNEFMGGPLTSQHFYKLNLLEDEVATIVLRSNNFPSVSTDFNIYDQDGKNYQTYSSTNSSYSNYTVKDIRANRTSTFYIGIPSKKSTYGNYEIGVFKGWKNVDQKDDERNYFGSYSTARYLKSGTYNIENRFEDPKRYFRFMAKEGDKIAINLKNNGTNDPLDGWITDETLNEIKHTKQSNGYTYINNGETGSLEYTIPADGMYYFVTDCYYSSYDGVGTMEISFEGIRQEEDTDKDGVFDSTEKWRGTDPNKVDSDGDGISDYDELKNGSSPIIDNNLVTSDSAGDTKSNAIEVKNFDKLVSTKISSETDTWFKFNLLQGQQVNIDALLRVSYTTYFHCYLRDKNGNLIQEIDSQSRNSTGADKGYLYSFTASKTDTYYLDFNGSSFGRIDLTLRNSWRNPSVKDSERDYDYTFATSKYITDGRKVLPNNGLGNKYFRFTANVNNLISIKLKDIISSGDLKGYVVDKTGNTVFTLANVNDKNDTGISSNETASAQYKVPSTGVYYLVVSGTYGVFDLTTSGINGDIDSDVDGVSDIIELDRGTDLKNKDTDLDGTTDYDEYKNGTNPRIRTEFTDEAISNANTLVNANELNYINSGYSGSTSTNTEAWYKINLKANQTIELVAKGQLTKGYIIASICDSEGYEEYNMKTNIENTHYSNLTFKADKDDYYYIKILNNKAIGSYWFNIYNGWENTDEKDDNRNYYSSFSTAKQFSPGRYTTNSYGASYFRLNGKKDDTLKLGISAYLSSGSLTGKVYDQNYNLVTNFVTNVQGNAITNGMTSTLEYKYPADGIYYVEISGNTGDFELTTSASYLKLVNSSIKDGQRYDYTSNQVKLDFDQKIIASNTSNITFTTGTNEIIKASVELSGSSVTIKPTVALKKNTQYTLNVPKDAFTNICGATSEKDYIVKFSTICTDVNQDGAVDIKDLAAVASDYEKTASDSSFDTNKDINGDKMIDIFDLVFVAKDFN
ncbi:Ig-like domain-containing protein [Clostridium sp. YIM B02505]|uniref:Ig-like domain-containing protein n=1 Tax=Clostridium yunnanense TaxID=2800325 RepID=A0ABS1EX01_9CLOT|nr:pre-peptidase C-terminal domain-containing protein [Clostridium yunnanense]MBK1813866.1 Ig-like domain-containing protein [Clostridium yunnanense]